MEYPELEVDSVSYEHLDTYLTSVYRTLSDLLDVAAHWSEFDEVERNHFRLDLSRTFGLRHVLGAAYQASQFDARQTARLVEVDRKLLMRAVEIEVISGTTLRQLVQDLFAWGRPLVEQAAPVRIENTITALVELAAA